MNNTVRNKTVLWLMLVSQMRYGTWIPLTITSIFSYYFCVSSTEILYTKPLNFITNIATNQFRNQCLSLYEQWELGQQSEWLNRFSDVIFVFRQQRNYYAGAFHDTLVLYANVINHTLAEGGNVQDGAALVRKMQNSSFKGKLINIKNEK